MKRLGELLSRAGQNWMDHNASRIGAALAFYTLLAFPPLVTFAITAGSLLFDGTRTEAQVLMQINELAGTDAAKLAQDIIERPHTQPSGIGAALLGILTLLVGASGVFAELRSALNTIWEIPPQPGNGAVQWLKSRVLSIGIVLAVGFVLMASLIVSAILAAMGKYLGEMLPLPAPLLETLNFLIAFAGSTAMFGLILRYIPDARLPWRSVAFGAIMTAFLFALGKSVIGFYLGRTAIGSPYGPGGSVVVLIAWVYYSAQIFLFGAEFTQTLAKDHARPR